MLDLVMPRLSRATRDWFTGSPLESSADPYVQYLLYYDRTSTRRATSTIRTLPRAWTFPPMGSGRSIPTPGSAAIHY